MSGDEDEAFGRRNSRKSLSTPRRKRPLSLESDDEDDPKINCRSSDRILQKKNRKFSMPTRDAVWNSIPSCTSPEKALGDIKPKKVVSNLTKVYNSYNAERVSSEEEYSEEDFIDDHISGDTSSSEDEKQHKARCSRIKNYKKKLSRVSTLDSDSESDSEKEEINPKLKKGKSKQISSDSNSSDSGSYCMSRGNKKQHKKKDKSKENLLHSDSSTEEKLNKETDSKKRRNGINEICADSDSKGSSTKIDDDVAIPSTSGLNKNEKEDRLDSSDSSEDESIFLSGRKKSNVLDSDDEDDDKDKLKMTGSRRLDRARETGSKEKAKTKFQEFREARKRRMSDGRS